MKRIKLLIKSKGDLKDFDKWKKDELKREWN